MCREHIFSLLLVVCLISSCTADHVLTRQQIMMQNTADTVVAGILFDKDMEALSSYKIRKDTSVIIHFDAQVSEQQYTDVVQLLRSNAAIKSVSAEQGGVQVCPLNPARF